MDHLHSNQIVHRDLAARNILIQFSLDDLNPNKKTNEDSIRPRGSSISGITTSQARIIPKISDFGLASTSNRKTKIAVRWAAPEVLMDSRKTSQKSDVWSFGIVLFEISVACQIIPFSEINDVSRVRECICSGHPLTFPEKCHVEYQAVAKACLSFSSALRPSFSQIYEQFSNIHVSVDEEGENHQKEGQKRGKLEGKVINDDRGDMNEETYVPVDYLL
eukprot:TRINITY_DN6156_c0_g1_i1.p1 TRINITY_DN6156_c0_g1~~TRINITY_DN6156_c0_g1_i1.p1  ORF type:complete len:234 (-),score=60.34 TRINITY_DN6156_c0_g1_i1:179-835(-)